MRVFILLTFAAALGAVVIACNSNETLLSQNSRPANQTATPQQPPADNARRISAEELHKLWETNEVLIIDTRAESAYKQEHIKGSISLPTGTVLQHVDELPRNKMIVAYCT
jgi:predicted sulfurtransferase